MITTAQKNYLIWLRDNFPELYNQYAAPLLDGQLGDTNSDGQSTFASIIDSITGVIPSLAQAYTATKVSALAQQTAQVRAATQPTTVMGLSPTTLMIGGGILLAGVLLLSRRH